MIAFFKQFTFYESSLDTLLGSLKTPALRQEQASGLEPAFAPVFYRIDQASQPARLSPSEVHHSPSVQPNQLVACERK